MSLAVVFLAISLFVSVSLVNSLRGVYLANGQSPAIRDALHLLQQA
ncbi:MAG: hypothetical protein P4M09_23275 [Devosia sp.]|nr:hypothetical protein [Devosia sp.]